jgi:hypothetical protein
MSDPNRIRCTCPRCTIRGLMWPAVIISVGLLLLLSEMRGGFFDFSNTYPVILLVIGGVSLASALAPMTGHVAPVPPVRGVPQGVPPGVPPIVPPGTPGTPPTWQPPQDRQGQ